MFGPITHSALSFLLSPISLNNRIKADKLTSLINANSNLPVYCEKTDDEHVRPNFQYGGSACFMIADIDGISLPFFDHTYRNAGFAQEVVSLVAHRRMYVYCFANTSCGYSHKVIVANQYIDDWEKIGDYDGEVPSSPGLSYTVTYASDAETIFSKYKRYRITRK